MEGMYGSIVMLLPKTLYIFVEYLLLYKPKKWTISTPEMSWQYCVNQLYEFCSCYCAVVAAVLFVIIIIVL